MKYVIQSRKNPQNESEEKYYLIAKSQGVVDLKQICEEISLSTTLTRGDVRNTLLSFLDIIPKYLKMGYSVKLDELGSFRLSIKSKGSDTEEDVSISKVQRIRPVFLASTELKKQISDTHLEAFNPLNKKNL